RTLHRISAIRNRSGRVVGLTCRIGRAVFGTIDIMRDVVETGKSILMLGKPGVGKTTKCREVARVLSEEFGKRVVIVDTSNEIAGDGDIPHPAIGRDRRMQVATPELQDAVMTECVEDHMPGSSDHRGPDAPGYSAPPRNPRACAGWSDRGRPAPGRSGDARRGAAHPEGLWPRSGTRRPARGTPGTGPAPRRDHPRSGGRWRAG